MKVLVFEQGTLNVDPGMPHIIVRPGSAPLVVQGDLVFAQQGSIVEVSLEQRDGDPPAVVEVRSGRSCPVLMDLPQVAHA